MNGMAIGVAFAVALFGGVACFATLSMALKPNPVGFFLGIAIVVCTGLGVLGLAIPFQPNR